MTIVHDKLQNLKLELEVHETKEISRNNIEGLILEMCGGSLSTMLNYIKLMKMQGIIQEKPFTRGKIFEILVGKTSEEKQK